VPLMMLRKGVLKLLSIVAWVSSLTTIVLDLETIRAARDRILDRVHYTPVITSRMIESRLDRASPWLDDPTRTLFFKCENLQKTGSFKPRGAFNAISRLTPQERERGVVTFSAGTHAQAVAWASSVAQVQATVVMPAAATQAKVDASRGYGAEVVLHGANGREALRKAQELMETRGLTMVHPFDDERIMAGTGTVGWELVEQVPDLDAVIVGIGGGGLIAGIASAVKALSPKTKVIGVEPEGAPGMRRSLDAGKAVTLERVQTIADGLAAPMAGDLTFPIVQRLVDDVVLVSDDAIAAAMRDLLRFTKMLVEPGGAAATAAVLSGVIPVDRYKRVGIVLSGGNVDLSRLKELVA
jgi:threonine ammonia-lyase medium form